ncbi:hypothetical protein HDU82_001900, partial [Entophlyctis luteolus]
PYAVISVMVSQVSTAATFWLMDEMPLGDPIYNATTVLDNGIPAELQPQYIGIVMLITFSVSIIQLLVCVLGLSSKVAAFIPDSLIAGFMASSGISVLVSQLKPLFGISVPQFDGPLSLIFTFLEVLKRLPSTNWYSFGLAICTFVSLQVFERLEIWAILWWRRRQEATSSAREGTTPPTAVLDVILTVLLASFITEQLDLADSHNVKTIGVIPNEFPIPTAPWAVFTSIPDDVVLPLVAQIIPGSVSLALVSFVTTYSISKTFGLKTSQHEDERAEIAAVESSSASNPQAASTSQDVEAIVPNPHPNSADGVDSAADTPSETLLALSLSTLTGSFLSAYVPSGSISRSALLATQTRATSPIASLVAVAIVVAVLLWFAAAFANVPLACLAAIVVVALRGVLARCYDALALLADAREKRHNVLRAIGVLVRTRGRANTANAANSEFVICDFEDSPVVEMPCNDENPVNGSSSAEAQHDRDLYILKLKYFAVHKEVLCWFLTFLCVIFFDAGTGILVGMLVSAIFVVLSSCIQQIQKVD